MMVFDMVWAPMAIIKWTPDLMVGALLPIIYKCLGTLKIVNWKWHQYGMRCTRNPSSGGLAVRGDANNSRAGGHSLKRKQGSAAHESAHLL